MRTMILAAAMLLPATAAMADCGHRNDTRCTLTVGAPAQSTPWLRPDERDWWRTQLRRGVRYEALVNDGGNGCSFMSLRDRFGRVVWRQTVQYEHTDFNTSLRFNGPSDGTYYVVVEEAFCGGDTGIPMPPGYTIQLYTR